MRIRDIILAIGLTTIAAADSHPSHSDKEQITISKRKKGGRHLTIKSVEQDCLIRYDIYTDRYGKVTDYIVTVPENESCIKYAESSFQKIQKMYFTHANSAE